MTIVVQTLGLMCGFAAATFATAATDRRTLVAVPVGFIPALAWIAAGYRPGSGAIGLLAASVAAFALLRPASTTPVALAAGVLAACWAWFLASTGLPMVIAVAIAVALLAVAANAARRPGFVEPTVRDEALLMICGLAIVVSIAPDLLDGWRSAAALNVGSSSVPIGRAGGTWVVIVSTTALVLGSGWTVFARKR